MKELIEYIATSLVDQPDEVTVTQIRRGPQIVLKLQVAKGDMGRVIGKNGKVANAMRELLKISAAQDRKRVILDIVEPE